MFQRYFAPLTREACTKNHALHVFIEVQNVHFKNIHTMTNNIQKSFVADMLMQTDMFIYCFDTFLDNKNLYLLRQMTYFRLSIVFHLQCRREYHVHFLCEICETHVMDTTKGYFTQRNVVRNGIRTKHQIFRTSIFILVHIHTFHFNFC